MSKVDPQITDAEWIVMEAVWNAAAPVRAREVHARAAVATDWAYTTVKTMLTRLVEKGVLREARDGNAAVYEPLLSRARARRSALKALVARAFGGRVGTLVQHMAEQERLSARDRSALRAMLADLDRGGAES